MERRKEAEGREEILNSASLSLWFCYVSQVSFAIHTNSLTCTFKMRQLKEKKGQRFSVPDCSLIMQHGHDFCGFAHIMYIKRYFTSAQSFLHIGLGSQGLQITWLIKNCKLAMEKQKKKNISSVIRTEEDIWNQEE